MSRPGLMRQMTEASLRQYRQTKTPPAALMELGMRLHSFADTCAHQGFSGLWGWENRSLLTRVTDNTDGKDCTTRYAPQLYRALPSIGHANVNHAPDDGNVTLSWRMQDHEDREHERAFTRDNTEAYLDISREILDILRASLGREPVADEKWSSLKNVLRQGFLYGGETLPDRVLRWSNLRPDIRYAYDREPLLSGALSIAKADDAHLNGTLLSDAAILRSALSPEVRPPVPAVFRVKSDAFFRYNVIAKATRDTVMGKITAADALTARDATAIYGIS